MSESKFHSRLSKYVSANDSTNANKVIMLELANCLVKSKSDFIEVLRSANISIPDTATDIQLINAFVDNAPSNRKLLIGAAFMINHKNQKIGFDGTGKVSDAGVKAAYKVMYNYFDASNYDDTSDVVNDDYYDATGEDEDEFYNLDAGSLASSSNPAGAIATAAGELAKLGGKLSEGNQKKKYGASDNLAKQSEARRQITQSVLQQRQDELAAKTKAKEQKSKTTRTILIVTGIVLTVAAIGTAIYFVKKSKTQSK